MKTVDQALDCYGLLYEPALVPCRDKCELRFQCKEALQTRLAAVGQAELERQQRGVILANEAATRGAAQQDADRRHAMEPVVSPLVSEVMTELGKLGMRPVIRRGYVALKMDNRNVFVITKCMAKRLPALVKCIYHQTPSQMGSLAAHVSTETYDNSHAIMVHTVPELVAVVARYLDEHFRKEA